MLDFEIRLLGIECDDKLLYLNSQSNRRLLLISYHKAYCAHFSIALSKDFTPADLNLS